MNSNIFKMNFDHANLGKCKYGWFFYNGPYIGKCLELYGEYSESEVSVFKNYIKPGDYVVEVGANIGSLTVPISKLAGPEGRLVVFESHPETFNMLCANLAINNLKNVRPINAFVCKNTSIDTSSPVWGKYAFVSDIWPTTFQQIDHLQLPRIDFIKIDVDGNELEVLMSGEESIRKYPPIIYFENDIKEKSAELLSWVIKMQYKLYFHPAPIFSPNNFYGNQKNAWEPKNICSLMMLAIPIGKLLPQGLREVKNSNDWWE